METRNSTGLTETHGTFARRHWWRTGTWWNTSPAAMQGLNVTVRGTNAEAELARRVWQKVNDVSNWHAQAMANDYGRFSVDVLYPASDYLGVATSRAAYKQIQLVYAHGTNDSVLFHEYGHEVYYRQLFGSTLYESYNTATSATYPTCGGCIGHSLEKDIGPEAAMIEGWADFFEAVTTDNVPNAASEGIAYWVEYPDRYPSVPTGPGSELRVASFLYDLYDADLEGYYNEWDDDALKPAGGLNRGSVTLLNMLIIFRYPLSSSRCGSKTSSPRSTPTACLLCAAYSEVRLWAASIQLALTKARSGEHLHSASPKEFENDAFPALYWSIGPLTHELSGWPTPF
ncbi:hypothetical protein [Deinococcus radiophilus]|uniref:hypothetical protein n=1 Tax=Deinococcus radiophilus TaxID=32062 RepID=UPI0036192651